MTARALRERLARRARRANLDISDDVRECLLAYYSLLVRWNSKINLTSLDRPDESIDRLLLEPLVAGRYVGEGVRRVMDVGSGAGSPGLPLKFLHPEISLWLVESKARKSAFLREVVRQLGLDGVTVETARYEELLTRPELHEGVDVLTVRAVRVEARVLVRLQAFIRTGGRLFHFRGPAGPVVPPGLTLPLGWEATYPLVDALQSQLVIMRKAPLGGEAARGGVG